jgi:hypothetical protein
MQTTQIKYQSAIQLGTAKSAMGELEKSGSILTKKFHTKNLSEIEIS